MKTTCTKVALVGSLAVVAAGCAEVAFPDITNGQGEIAGEVTMTSVVLQSRLTVGSELVDGDLVGAQGTAQFELATTSEFSNSFESDWLLADHVSPVAGGGLRGTTGHIWSGDGRLLASGGAQLFCVQAVPTK